MVCFHSEVSCQYSLMLTSSVSKETAWLLNMLVCVCVCVLRGLHGCACENAAPPKKKIVKGSNWKQTGGKRKKFCLRVDSFE